MSVSGFEKHQMTEVGEHADLRRQLGEVVVRDVQMFQRLQLSNCGWQVCQVVVVEVKSLDESVCVEENRRDSMQTLSSKIQLIPGLS